MAAKSDDPTSAADPASEATRPARVPAALFWSAYWVVLLGVVGVDLRWLRAGRHPPDTPTVNSWIAQCRLDEADAALRLRLRQSPHDGDALILRARVLAMKGNAAGSAEELRRVPFWWPGKNEALFREGQAWMSIDRAKDAEAAWRRYVRDDPRHPSPKQFQSVAEVELINLYALEERWDEARELIWKQYDRSLSEGRDPHDLLFMSLRTRLSKTKPEESVVVLRRYVRADPSDWQARMALARASQALGQLEESDRQIRACLEACPSDPHLWSTWLGILEARSDFSTLADELARVPPEAVAVIARYRGLVAFRSGNLAEAADAYRRAVEERPFDGALHHNLALIEGRLGNLGRASQHGSRHETIRSALAILPDVFDDYADARQERFPPDSPRLVASAARLVELCRTLGWERDAAGWDRLLQRLLRDSERTREDESQTN